MTPLTYPLICPATAILPEASFVSRCRFIVSAVFSIRVSPNIRICGRTNKTRKIDIIVPRPSAIPIAATVGSDEILPIKKPALTKIEPEVNIVGNAWLIVSVIAFLRLISFLSTIYLEDITIA